VKAHEGGTARSEGKAKLGSPEEEVYRIDRHEPRIPEAHGVGE
jgi:hypothetical protein